MSKESNPFWGKNHSPAVKIALKAIRTAAPSGKRRSGPPKGYHHTPEAKAVMSKIMKQRWIDNRDAMLARFQTPPKSREEQRYRKNFTPWQRRNWKSDKCLWCETTESLVLDHTVSVRDGGLNIKENAQTLCQPCNLWKSVNVDRPMHLARLALQGGSVNG
jgi:5-methylcytosine-specific restriction endonuclease McrA